MNIKFKQLFIIIIVVSIIIIGLRLVFSFFNGNIVVGRGKEYKDEEYYQVRHINNNNKLSNIPLDARYIAIHSTRNPTSNAHDERNNLERIDNTDRTGFHIVVDDTRVIECIPLYMVAWHAGDGDGPGNRESISIEICESGDRQKTLDNAAKLVADMLYEREWPVERVYRHFDFSGKECPAILSGNNWEDWRDFKNKIQYEVDLLIEEQLERENL